MFGCHQQHELSCVHQKRKQHQIFLSKMDLALVTAAESAMCYPECTSSARVSAASCHEQPQLTHVSEERSLCTTCSLPWKPWPASHSWCFTLTTSGFDSRLGGKSVLERRQGWLAESVSSASRDCHGGRQLNSSWAGGLEWDSACALIVLGFAASSCKCTSCQGSLWAVLAGTNPRYVEMCCLCPFPST